ncbi:MAG: SH3 domain-containing protein [Rhizobiaceae bacterium]|nr:SH3 domain-containing protein [Rhizobiaceae bacterium]
MTGAIAPEEAAPQPVRKPKKNAAKAEPAEKQTEIASLPGVNVGGLAGHPADDDDNSDSTVRTVVKSSGGAVAGTAQVKSAVNMRSAPKKGASVLGVVPAGTSVKVMSCDGWCQISWNGRNGWVYKSFLSATKKPAPTAEKQPARKVQSTRS